MLTGQKFEILLLLGFPLSTRAVFDKSGKMLFSILNMIDLVKSGVKESTVTFISFGENVSIAVASIEFNPCISFFTSISFTK